MSEIIYIVKNSDSDGYNQEFTKLPTFTDGSNNEEYWHNGGYLKEGDEIYQCIKIGIVEKQLIIKKE